MLFMNEFPLKYKNLYKFDLQKLQQKQFNIHNFLL